MGLQSFGEKAEEIGRSYFLAHLPSRILYPSKLISQESQYGKHWI